MIQGMKGRELLLQIFFVALPMSYDLSKLLGSKIFSQGVCLDVNGVLLNKAL